MTIGEKIRYIRIFRGMSQVELGESIGFQGKVGGIRIAQYEASYRVPKKNRLLQIANVLQVHPFNFYIDPADPVIELVQCLLWLDENNPDAIKLILPTKDLSNRIQIDALATTGLYFNNEWINQFLLNWSAKKQELHKSIITPHEYFEWKVNSQISYHV